MEMIDRLGSLEIDYLIDWIKQQPFRPEVYKGKLSGRDCVWWGREIIDYGLSTCSYQETIPFPVKLIDLKERYYPEANSCLLYRYEKGKGISSHKDKGCESKVVLINLLDTYRNLFGIKESEVKFHLGLETYSLKDGDVIAFNSALEHSINPIPCVRYSLQFRVVN